MKHKSHKSRPSHPSLPTPEQCRDNIDLLEYLDFWIDRQKFVLDQLKEKICRCDMRNILRAIDAYAAAAWFAKKKGVGK